MTSHAETFQGYLSDTLQRAESWVSMFYTGLSSEETLCGYEPYQSTPYEALSCG